MQMNCRGILEKLMKENIYIKAQAVEIIVIVYYCNSMQNFPRDLKKQNFCKF